MTSPVTPYPLDPVLHADMIDQLSRDDCRVVCSSATGLLLRTRSGTALMASADEDSARMMVDQAGSCPQMVAHDAASVAATQARLGLDHHTPCWSAAYLGTGLPPITLPGVSVDQVTERWAPLVCAHYDMDGSTYTRSRIDAQVMLGAFRGDELLGFIGQHEQGAMGLLVVLPQYRRQGVAELLLTDLTTRILAEGRTPYDHIIQGNEASVALHRKLGFTLSTGTLTWMSRSAH